MWINAIDPKSNEHIDVHKDSENRLQMIETRKENILNSVNMDIVPIRDIIRKNIVDQYYQNRVFRCIWFFYTTMPNIAKQLLKYVEQNDIKSFVELVYQNIYQAIDARLKTTYHDVGNAENPWKEDIKRWIWFVDDAKNDISTDINWWSRLDTPPILVWALPTERMDIRYPD
jgi:hypothetical protein